MYVFCAGPNAVHPRSSARLQILQQSHSGLIQLLGKTSGRDVDKISELQGLGLQLQQEYGLPVLSGNACCICIDLQSHLI
jgi:hypothetical protein